LANINGTSGNDNLVGTTSADTISGLEGNDTLTGGAGNDVFVYNATADSTTSAFDTITDFTQGADKIDLRPLLGATDLIFVGTTPTLNGVWFQQDVSLNKTFVFADVTGNNTPDLKIQLNGLFTLTSADFLGVAEGDAVPLTVTIDTTNPTVAIDIVATSYERQRQQLAGELHLQRGAGNADLKNLGNNKF